MLTLVPDGPPFRWPEQAAAASSRAQEFVPAQQELQPVDGQRERVRELEDELAAAAADRAQLAEQNRTLRQQGQELRRQLRSAEDRHEALERRVASAADPLSSERAFLLGVRQAYARMFEEGDRVQYPLRRMRVGPDFLASLRALDGIDLDKVLEVCAQVAADKAHEIAAREVHQLRAGLRGAGTHVRADQGQAWRCSLQVKTPSARRLHWWNVPGADGPVIEFAQVGVHDDFDIPG